MKPTWCAITPSSKGPACTDLLLNDIPWSHNVPSARYRTWHRRALLEDVSIKHCIAAAKKTKSESHLPGDVNTPLWGSHFERIAGFPRRSQGIRSFELKVLFHRVVVWDHQNRVLKF